MKSIEMPLWKTFIALAPFILVACDAQKATPKSADGGVETPPVTNTAPLQYTDPFAYCEAVGTIDAADGRYIGPGLPQAITEGVRENLDLPLDAPADWVDAGVAWRCMNSKVWACFKGANLPCSAQAVTSRTPTAAMEEFCTTTLDADSIPVAVTGRETVYQWSCVNGTPQAGDTLYQPDAQGFLSNFWHEIKPTGGDSQ